MVTMAREERKMAREAKRTREVKHNKRKAYASQNREAREEAR